MRTVNIAELKSHLKAYVAYAKAGETVVVRERGTPIAQLVPVSSSVADLSVEEDQLVADGILRRGEGLWDISAFDDLPWPAVEGDAATQALLDERNELI